MSIFGAPLCSFWTGAMFPYYYGPLKTQDGAYSLYYFLDGHAISFTMAAIPVFLWARANPKLVLETIIPNKPLCVAILVACVVLGGIIYFSIKGLACA